MPIVYFSGPEGAGKTNFMTRECRVHHKAGGVIFSFPGYEVMDDKGKVISKLLLPEQWVNLPPELTDAVIAIDEVTNFFNKHNWYNKMVDMMTALGQQRRKRSLCILMTGPIFEWLPSTLRDLVHEIVRCEDRHWKVKAIPKGEQVVFTREDHRGMLSGYPGRRTPPRIFKAKRYWKYYNTYAIVDFMHQFDKVRFYGHQINIGPDGKIISEGEMAGGIGEAPATGNSSYYSITSQLKGTVEGIISQLRGRGLKVFPYRSLYDMVRAQAGLNVSNNTIGKVMSSLNIRKQEGRNPVYVLSE